MTVFLRKGLPLKSVVSEWIFDAPAGSKAEDYLEPSSFKHVATEMRMRPRDSVRIDCLDGSWMAEYMVLHVGPHHAKLKLLPGYPLMLEDLAEEVDKSDVFTAVWKGPAARWCAQRISDGEIVKNKFQTKEQAVVWINTQAKALAA